MLIFTYYHFGFFPAEYSILERLLKDLHRKETELRVLHGMFVTTFKIFTFSTSDASTQIWQGKLEDFFIRGESRDAFLFSKGRFVEFYNVSLGTKRYCTAVLISRI